jgi:beta-galactosidase beta subunit
VEETDQHLFFLCPFARASWFMNPWHLKIDQFVSPSDSISQILIKLLNMNHPNGSIDNILTFMWSLWKSRNDYLFNKKDSTPTQIYQMTIAIKKNLELLDVVQVTENRLRTKLNAQEDQARQDNTIRTDLQIQGSKIFMDAAWKKRKVQDNPENCKTGIGVYCQLISQGREETLMIQASTAHSSSPLLAEADALLFATKVAAQVQAQGITFLTDNLTLARAASATAITNEQVPWELRQQIAGYKRDSEELQSKIYHINRNLNGVAHDCANRQLDDLCLCLSSLV